MAARYIGVRQANVTGRLASDQKACLIEFDVPSPPVRVDDLQVIHEGTPCFDRARSPLPRFPVSRSCSIIRRDQARKYQKVPPSIAMTAYRKEHPWIDYEEIKTWRDDPA